MDTTSLSILDRESVVVWPCLREERLGDWVLRIGGGVYGRSNSVQPYGSPGTGLDEAIARCEDVYHGAGLRPMFRLPHCIPWEDLDVELAGRGYEVSDEAEVMVGSIGGADLDPDIKLLETPTEEWLASYRRGSGRGTGREEAVNQLLLRLGKPRTFAQMTLGGEIVCVGIGAVHRETVWLFGIATDTHYRGRGFARRVVGTLLAWAKSMGAVRVALQVSSSNEPAIRLYSRLGLAYAYRYHYRRL